MHQKLTYHLLRGDALLGTVTLDASLGDFPWHNGQFEPAPAFESVRELFNQDLQLLDAEDWDRWDKLWLEIIQPGLRLHCLESNETISELLIHINGDKAWWRC